MKDVPLQNIAASVKHRLLERSRQRGEDFQFVLTAKRMQWTAFVRRLGLSDEPGELTEVVADVRSFLEPVIKALTAEKSFDRHWAASGKWKRSSPRST